MCFRNCSFGYVHLAVFRTWDQLRSSGPWQQHCQDCDSWTMHSAGLLKSLESIGGESGSVFGTNCNMEVEPVYQSQRNEDWLVHILDTQITNQRVNWALRTLLLSTTNVFTGPYEPCCFHLWRRDVVLI